MGGAWHNSLPVFRCLVVWLGVAAMLSRALLPAGVMPDPTAAFKLVICTGSGVKTLPDGDKDRSPKPSIDVAPCPFSVGHLATPAEILLPILHRFPAIFPVVSPRRPALSAANRPYGARAPPRLT